MPCLFQSGKRDSNSRPSAWEADALPTELLPLLFIGCQYLLNLIPLGFKGQNYTLRSNKPNQIYRKFISTAE